jgi:hypothetical protein
MTTLFPDIARSSLRPLEAAAEQESPAHDTGMLRAIMYGNGVAAEGIEKLWEKEKARLNDGVLGHVFRQTVDSFVDSLQVLRRVTLKIDARADERGDEALDVRADAKTILATADRLLKEATWFQQWLASSNTPEALARAAAEAQRVMDDPNTKWVSGDEIVDRILAGEDV